MIDLTYTVRRLLVRDELVFKSIVRILHGQTRHNWLYTPEIDANLVVIGPAPDVEPCPDSLLEGKVLLKLGASELSHQYSTVAMQVGDILAKLNLHGEKILAARGTPLTARAQPQLASDYEHYALLRWPDWSIMQKDRLYMRIATVLAARPVGLHELANKADVDVQVCVEFLRLLNARNLIRSVAPAAAPAATSAHVNGASSLNRSASTAASEPSFKQPSLWGRIRSRLGIARESRAS
jgi:hypothetical protein